MRVVCWCRWLNAMSAAVAAAKKQLMSPVDEIITDAVLDVTDSGSTLRQIEQYDIV